MVEDYFYEFMREAHYNADDVFLSLVEAVVNAIKHGNKCDIAKTVEVEIIKEPSQLKLIIQDHGAGFDLQKVKDPTLPEHLPIPGGRGVFLIRKLMDEVIYDFSASGTCLTLIKHEEK